MQRKETLLRLTEERRYAAPQQWQVPLLPSIRAAMRAVLDGAPAPTPAAVREAIAASYRACGADIAAAAVRLGVRTWDLAALAAEQTVVALSHPGDLSLIYPHVGDGRTGRWHRGFFQGVEYLTAFDEIDFRPTLPVHEPGLAYLASPNPATGVVLTARDMLRWVRYAEQTGMHICHDASLSAYVSDEPTTFLATPGATAVVAEVVDLAAVGLAGATYAVVPPELQADDRDKKPRPYGEYVHRYLEDAEPAPVVLAGMAAWYSPQGQAEWRRYCTAVAARTEALGAAFRTAGVEVWGSPGVPILWTTEVPSSLRRILADENILPLDGGLFGPAGEGYLHWRVTVPAVPEEENT
ncbi:MAG: hypothetical protein MR209_01115 [Veillonellaceae bacterium]|nr:hypothetical protein [Veillonellaceae bacterium]